MYLRVAEESKRQFGISKDPFYFLNFFHCLNEAICWIEEFNFEDIFVYLSSLNDLKKALIGLENLRDGDDKRMMNLMEQITFIFCEQDNIKIQAKKENLVTINRSMGDLENCRKCWSYPINGYFGCLDGL